MKSKALALIILSVLSDYTHSHEEPAQPDAVSQSSLGLGFGVPYGFISGFNFSHQMTDKVDLSLGLGLGVVLEAGWSVGVRIYPMNHSKLRLSALYGTNGEADKSYCGRVNPSGGNCYYEKNKYYGLNLGIGLGPRAGASGWSFDVIFATTSNEPGKTNPDDNDSYTSYSVYSHGYSKDNGHRVQTGLGYQWAF